MKHPVSTLTNFCYFATGFYLWNVAPIVSVSLFLLTVGSGLYHWTLKDFGRFLDWLGMYAVMASLITLPLYLSGYVWGSIALYLVLTAGAGFAIRKFELRTVLAVLAIPVLIISLVYGDVIPTLGGLALFGVALFAREMADKEFGGRQGQNLTHEILHGIIWHPMTAYMIQILAWNLL